MRTPTGVDHSKMRTWQQQDAKQQDVCAGSCQDRCQRRLAHPVRHAHVARQPQATCKLSDPFKLACCPCEMTASASDTARAACFSLQSRLPLHDQAPQSAGDRAMSPRYVSPALVSQVTASSSCRTGVQLLPEVSASAVQGLVRCSTICRTILHSAKGHTGCLNMP